MFDKLKVFTAKKMITMNPSRPIATAVAVRGDQIVSVGSLEDLKPWLDAYPYEIDDTFGDKIIMPGFIDPHLHPFLGAVAVKAEFITPDEWRLPWGTIQPVTGKENYLKRLRELEAGMDDPNYPLLTWGYHQLYHGDIYRAELDSVSSTRPICIWHRSAHEMILNSAALRTLDITADTYAGIPMIDYERGHFIEAGLLGHLLPKIAPFLFGLERFTEGLKMVAQVIHAGGVTVTADMSFGASDPTLEWAGPAAVLDNDDIPFRTYFVADLLTQSQVLGIDEAFDWVESLNQKNTHRLRFLKNVKLFADGAFYSQLMQMKAGYIDGHHGEWMTPPETLEQLARRYWNAGYQIHVHTNGDLGMQLVLDILQKLQDERPRFDHRFTIEHFGYANYSQIRKLARLGGVVSANPYYLHVLGDLYAQQGMGADRTAQITPVGSCIREGIPVALHSDFSMAPAAPLSLAWAAISRQTIGGNVMGPEERLTLDQALRAITLDAAFALGVEAEIGSIVSGKTANFTVLEADPYDVPLDDLKDIPVWGTVFEGQVHPVAK